MAAGRRHESRIHAIQQAALVWCLNELDTEAFIRRGELPGSAERIELDPELQVVVDAKMAEVMRTGKLIC